MCKGLSILKAREYRPDIDGLRGVAVTSVLIHHINGRLLPGGFIGVDIFFVISGFLITSHIFREIQAGSFQWKEFYKRRINRILPAFLTMIAFCLLVSPFLLSANDLIVFTKSAFAAVVGLSNIFFLRAYGAYFAPEAGEAVLLHTWTLGVEEQFYIIWPILLLLIVSLARHRLLTILAGLTIVAVVVSAYGAEHFPKAAYYLLPTRFFELLIGGILAVFLADRQRPRWSHSPLVALVGYFLILYGLFRLNSQSTFPGLNALFPCLGSALLILYGTDRRPSAVLSNRVLVFIGLISYSLYLWHWPIIAYVNYLGIPIGPTAGLGIVALSVSLAWLSWKYIEVPFRSSGAKLRFGEVVIRRFAAPAFIIFSLALVCIGFNGFPNRFDPSVSTYEAMAATKPNEIRSRCHASIVEYDRKPDIACRLGAEKEYLDGILIGDSFANHFTGMVDVLAKADGIAIMDYTMDACAPIIGYAPAMRGDYVSKCALRKAYVFDLLDQRKFRYVILAADWPSDHQAKDKIESTLAKIIAAGSQPIIILSNETIKRATSCPLRRLMFGLEQKCAVHQSAIPAYWEEIRTKYPEIRFINPNEVICSNGSCFPVVNETLLYRDSLGHLNDVGSRTIGRILASRGRSLLHDRKGTESNGF